LPIRPTQIVESFLVSKETAWRFSRVFHNPTRDRGTAEGPPRHGSEAFRVNHLA